MSRTTIIIPTVCSNERAASLRRAIDSVLNQTEPNVDVLIVANGVCVNATLFDELTSHDRVKGLRLDQGDLPLAIARGVYANVSPFFGFLDDDDVLFPFAIEQRLKAMTSTTWVVAAPGRIMETDGLRLPEKQWLSASHDPLSSLLTGQGNWLDSCGGLYQAKHVTPPFFDDCFRYYEWSYWATKLAGEGEVRLLPTPDHSIAQDTPSSLSKSDQYKQAEYDLIQYWLGECDRQGIDRDAMKRKESECCHALSDLALQQNQKGKAIKWHLKSLKTGYGFLSYGLYTIRLVC